MDEGDVRVGTRNSRAPSGEELRRTGVSTSVKPGYQLLSDTYIADAQSRHDIPWS